MKYTEYESVQKQEQDERRDLGVRHYVAGALIGAAAVTSAVVILANQEPDGNHVDVDVHQIEEMVGVNTPSVRGMGVAEIPSSASPADLPAEQSNFIRL